MVVILILPSSDEQPHQHQPQQQQHHHHHQQTPPPTSSISINGCDPFRLNEAPRIISNSNNSTHSTHQQQQQHEYHNRKRRSAPKRITFETDLINHRSPPPLPPSASGAIPSAAAYTATTTTTTSKKDRVRHITRVNISDVYSQVEIDGDAEPVTKEGKPKLCSSFYFHFHSFIHQTVLLAQNSLQCFPSCDFGHKCSHSS